MAHLVTAASATSGWITALNWLTRQPKGKAAHLNVAFPATADAHPEVESQLDRFLGTSKKVRAGGAELQGVQAVANTVFPESLYLPELGSSSREHLYELNRLSMELTSRRKSGERETYFNRLVAYPAGDGKTFNQLEFVVDRVAGQLRQRGGKSSAYEMGLTDPIGGDLRIQKPGHDKNVMGFPCLSHVSLTVCDGVVNLAAIYRNHSYISRTYGNYLGLSRLAAFIAREAGGEPGEVFCASTHADAEFGLFGGHRKVEAFAKGLEQYETVEA